MPRSDATIFVSSLEAIASGHDAKSRNRRAYLFVISGEVTLNDQRLRAGDQASISADSTLSIHAGREFRIDLLDLP